MSSCFNINSKIWHLLFKRFSVKAEQHKKLDICFLKWVTNTKCLLSDLPQMTQVDRICLDLKFKWAGSKVSQERYCLTGVSWAQLLPLRVAAPQITTSIPLSVILITRLLPPPHYRWAAVLLHLLQLTGCPWTMLQCTANALANLICLRLAYCL